MADGARRTAVVLFNLGGPDSLDSVRPFLFNLFNDPAIIGAPTPVRWLLARLISWRRGKMARGNYAKIGGASPLLGNTQRQAQALQRALDGAGEARCFVAMRYWRPFADEAAREVKAFDPDEIILLPLYPQYAAATTGSALKDWARAAAGAGLRAPTRTICCYPDDPGFVAAMAELTAEAWREAAKSGIPRILYSAHGLPRREIDRGDPYQWQVEQSAAAINGSVAALLGEETDWLVSYQSRVGPLEWLGPYTNNEISRAGGEGRPLVIVPLAFVSEHVETLVELDVDYREQAAEEGVPAFYRVPTVGENAVFIDGLADLVRRASGAGSGVAAGGSRRCPESWVRCPCNIGNGGDHG